MKDEKSKSSIGNQVCNGSIKSPVKHAAHTQPHDRQRSSGKRRK